MNSKLCFIKANKRCFLTFREDNNIGSYQTEKHILSRKQYICLICIKYPNQITSRMKNHYKQKTILFMYKKVGSKYQMRHPLKF